MKDKKRRKKEKMKKKKHTNEDKQEVLNFLFKEKRGMKSQTF